jgi:hypothetical protein
MILAFAFDSLNVAGAHWGHKFTSRLDVLIRLANDGRTHELAWMDLQCIYVGATRLYAMHGVLVERVAIMQVYAD